MDSIRKYRKVERAINRHKYEATVYQVNHDGSVKTNKVELAIDKTYVRLRSGNTQWEAYHEGAGWFSCDQPKKLA